VSRKPVALPVAVAIADMARPRRRQSHVSGIAERRAYQFELVNALQQGLVRPAEARQDRSRTTRLVDEADEEAA
jgi:hypothetical protein